MLSQKFPALGNVKATPDGLMPVPGYVNVVVGADMEFDTVGDDEIVGKGEDKDEDIADGVGLTVELDCASTTVTNVARKLR